MTMKDTVKKLQDELEGMRAGLDDLRVKGNLGKMELKDKLAEYKAALEPKYQKAKSTIADLSRDGAAETKTVFKSIVAGWDELRRTHKELAEETANEREKSHEAKRKT